MEGRRLALTQALQHKHISIRRFWAADVEPFAAILAEEKATRHLPFPHELRSADGAVLLIRKTMERYDSDTPSLAYAVSEQGGQSLIGFCGMNPLPDDEVELMYAVAPARWGERLGSAIAAALCAHVSGVDPRLRCVVFVHPENLPSIPIAKRLGFDSLGLTRHEMFIQPVLKFAGRTSEALGSR